MTYKKERGYRHTEFYGHTGRTAEEMRAESYTRTMVGVKLQREVDEAHSVIHFLRRARPIGWALIPALILSGGFVYMFTAQWWWSAIAGVIWGLILTWVLGTRKSIPAWEKLILENEPKIRNHHFESLKWLHRAEHREWEDQYDALLPLVPALPYYLDRDHEDYFDGEATKLRRAYNYRQLEQERVLKERKESLIIRNARGDVIVYEDGDD